MKTLEEPESLNKRNIKPFYYSNIKVVGSSFDIREKTFLYYAAPI